MQPRKKFDICKTTTGQLYKYYTASVILKALYKTYHTLDPKYWAVNCGLALAQPVSSITGSSTLATATGYAALGVSFIISPFTTAASFASNIIADQIIQVGWENLPEWCNDSKIVEECFALAYVAKTEAIAYQINKYEEKRNQEENDAAKKQADNSAEQQPAEQQKQPAESTVDKNRQSAQPEQPIQTAPASTPPAPPAQQNIVNQNIDDFHGKGYRLYKHGHGKHGNGKTIGAHMNPQAAKAWIEQGGTIECKKGGDKHWFSKPQEVQQAQTNQVALPPQQSPQAANVLPQPLPQSNPTSHQSDINQQMENLHSNGYRLYKHGHGKHGNGKTIGAHMSIQDAKSWIEQGGTIECKNEKSKHWFTKPQESQQMPAAPAVPTPQKQTVQSPIASHQPYAKPALTSSAQSDINQQIDALHNIGYRLYKHVHGKHGNGITVGGHLSPEEAKSWVQQGGTVECKNGKSKHWFTKPDENQSPQNLPSSEEAQQPRQSELNSGIFSYIEYLIFGSGAQDDPTYTEPSVIPEAPTVPDASENAAVPDVTDEEDNQVVIDVDPDPASNIDPIHHVDRKNILIVRLTMLEEVVAHYALISRRVRHGFFAGELPSNLRDITSIMSRMKSRDCLLRDALQNIIVLSADNHSILKAAKDCLCLIEGGIIQPDKKYPLRLAEIIDDENLENVRPAYSIK